MKKQTGCRIREVFSVQYSVFRGVAHALLFTFLTLSLLAPRALAATGGGGNSTNDTLDGNWTYHTFTNNGEFTVSGGSMHVQYLVVAGGGSGGSQRAGGGGAGGLLYGAATMIDATSPYKITVGRGAPATASGVASTSGGNTSISNATPAQVVLVNGGGGGGNQGGYAALSGGSGGGAGCNQSGGSGNTPPTTPSPQGNDGGAGGVNQYTSGAGGGGAGGKGGDVSGSTHGLGGAAVTNSITGSPVAYAQGGGGGNGSTLSYGLGGGSISDTNGVDGTGGGGGGGYGYNPGSGGGRGGDGIAIIRYFIGTDSTPPTLVSMDDGNLGRMVCPYFFQMTYTVTFSEDIGSMPTTNDFDNAGTAGLRVDSVARVAGSFSNFLVKVTPTSVGTLQLRVKASAVQDFKGNSMSADSSDDTTVTVSGNQPVSYGMGYTRAIKTISGKDCEVFTFTADGSLVMWSGSGRDVSEYLVVAGGGGGGGDRGGGGGAGGFLSSTTNLHLPATNYTIRVGVGGAGGIGDTGTGELGARGGNTSMSNATAALLPIVNGGGGGGGRSSGYSTTMSGGSGGGVGGTPSYTAGSGNTPPTTPAQGSDGGLGWEPDTYAGGGGGGAGGKGGNARSAGWYDNRGAPVTNSITGSDVAYAQGGGGGDNGNQGIGGGATSAQNGLNGTGGGGGGGVHVKGNGGRGGDGVLILVLPLPPKGTLIMMR